MCVSNAVSGMLRMLVCRPHFAFPRGSYFPNLGLLCDLLLTSPMDSSMKCYLQSMFSTDCPAQSIKEGLLCSFAVSACFDYPSVPRLLWLPHGVCAARSASSTTTLGHTMEHPSASPTQAQGHTHTHTHTTPKCSPDTRRVFSYFPAGELILFITMMKNMKHIFFPNKVE